MLDTLPSAAAQQTRPMRAPKKRRRSILRRFIGGIGIIAIVAVFVIAGLATLIRQDRVTDIAKQQIARLAGQGYATNISFASLSYFQNGLAGLDIQGVSVRNARTNQPLLENGRASFSISLINLLSGKVQLTNLSLSDARMQIDVSSGNGLTLSDTIFDKDGLIDPALVSKMLDKAAATISSRFAENPDLVIKADNIKLAFGTKENAFELLLEKLIASKTSSDEFAFDAQISNANWKTNLRGGVGKNAVDGTLTPYRIAMDPIPVNRVFEPQLPDLKPRSCTALVGFAVAASHSLASVDTTLSKGNCTFGALGDYAIDATINGNLKKGSGIFEIGRGVIKVNRSVLNFDGAIAPARYTPKPESAGETPRYRYELLFAPSTMDSLDNVEGPLTVFGKIAGTYAPSERRLAFDEFAADANGSIIRGAASLLFTDVTPALYLALTSEKIPVRDFKRIWPRFAAPTARRIVMERVSKGTIGNMRLELQLPPGKIGSKTPLEKEQLNASGDVEAVTFSTFGDLPPVSNGMGRVAFDGVSVDIKLKSGSVFLPSGDEVKLKPSSFVISDTHQTPVPADLEFEVSGSARSLAEIAAQKPINAFAGQEFSPADLSGNAAAKGAFQLLLVKKDEKIPAPAYDVTVNLSDVTIAKTVKGQKISGASGTIKANNKQIEIRVEAQLGGLPAKIIIFEPRNAPQKRTQDVTLTLTEAWRNKTVPGLKPFLSGPVLARVKGNSCQADVELDLTKATLRVLPFNWEKGAGIGAIAKFSFKADGADISISNLEVSGRGLSGTGNARISNGALHSGEFRNIRLNPGDNFSLSLNKKGQAISATIGGAQLDARSLMKQLLPGNQPRKISVGQSFEIEGNIKRLVGFNEETMVDANFSFMAGKNAALVLTGGFENGGSLKLSRSDGRLRVQTGNAGAALRFVDLYKRMNGGTLAVDFKIGAQGAMTGPISIGDFTVIGEPRLAKLASEQADGSTSLSKATQAKLASDKAKFELAQGEVTLESGTIALRNGIVRGANVGATAEGVVLSATGKMDLRGTFMPARGLNRIVGAIPILGMLLGSGNKAGLIGITYQLAGDAKNPKVFVNPISMIAPGVFRQIFE